MSYTFILLMLCGQAERQWFLIPFIVGSNPARAIHYAKRLYKRQTAYCQVIFWHIGNTNTSSVAA